MKIFLLLFISFLVMFFFSKAQTIKTKKDFDPDEFIRNLYGIPRDNIGYEDFYESLYQYYRQPLNINNASRSDLEKIFVLSQFQINNLLLYRKKYGKFFSIYELQAIKGFDVFTINNILPFITIEKKERAAYKKGIKNQIKYARYHYFMFRSAYSPQLKKGYMPADTLNNGRLASRYRGGPVSYLARYRLDNDRLGFGFTFEKDPGELFSLNIPGSYGFDFTSAHLQFKKRGYLKKLVIGDYQVQTGQGLAMSSGFTFGKGAEPVNTLRKDGDIVKPYTSSMEAGFLRGVATTLDFKKFELTGFFSRKKADANLSNTDSTNSSVSRLLESGLHRTRNEWNNRNSLIENTAGAYLRYSNKSKRLKVGLSFSGSRLSKNISSNGRIYNQFKFNGNENYNTGLDYQYLFNNINFFGELNRSKNGGKALISGFSGSLHDIVDVAFLYRNYERNFHTFYGNSFGESTTPNNEKGMYWGIKIRPFANGKLYGFYDRFYFPWFSFLTDSPERGWEYFSGLEYQITNDIKAFLQYRSEEKLRNNTNSQEAIQRIIPEKRNNVRFKIDFKSLDIITFSNNIYLSGYRFASKISRGLVLSQDLVFKKKNLQLAGRYAIFDTDDYQSRVYAYERDVLYDFSVPAYFGKGIRWYMMLKYSVFQNLDFWFRVAHTNYRDRKVIGSGLEEIKGSNKTGLKVQIKYDF